jgi:hypothetical protein
MKASAGKPSKERIGGAPAHESAVKHVSAKQLVEMKGDEPSKGEEGMGSSEEGSHHSSASDSKMHKLGLNELDEQDPIHEARGFLASKM